MNYLCDDRNPSVAGIIAGICKGGLWLNDQKNPVLAVTYSYCVGGCGISGDIQKIHKIELRQFLSKVFQDLLTKGIDCFEFSAEDPKIYNVILSLFAEKTIESEMEFSYRRGEAFKEKVSILEGYILQEVKGNILQDILDDKYENAEMFVDRFANSWNSKENFLENSKSFVAIYKNQIVGIIFGSARYQNIITIDIEVEEQHRKKNIATELTILFVNECTKNNLVAQWDHVESNHASAALATKCGFIPYKQRPYYWFRIEQEKE